MRFGAQGAPGKMMQSGRVATYVGSTTLAIGMALCFDTTQATADLQNTYVTTPELANSHRVAGYVRKIGQADPITGYEEVEVIPPGEGVDYNAEILTDENIVAGDVLGVIPGSPYFGKVIAGRGLFIATEAVNGSVTPALVQGDFGYFAVDPAYEASKVMRYFNHFTGDQATVISGFTPAEVDAAGLIVLASGGASSYASIAGGALVVTGAGSAIGQVRNSGFPVLLGTGTSVFFRCRLKFDAVSDIDAFVGLAITGTMLTDTTVPAMDDYIGFYLDSDTSGTWKLAHNRDNGTDALQTTGVSPVADTFTEVAFLVRNKIAGDAAGSTEVRAWVDGVEVFDSTAAAVAALINKDEAMGWVVAAIPGAPVITIDRIEVNHYFG